MTNRVTVLPSSDRDDDSANAVRDEVIIRLEHAGRTLLAMRDTGYSPDMKLKRYDIVRSVWEAYTSAAPSVRAPSPTAADLKLMDEALDWLLLIPDTRLALRKIVTARIWVHPLNDRYIYSWRVIAREMRTDHKRVQRLHDEGIKIIKKTLAQTPQTTL